MIVINIKKLNFIQRIFRNSLVIVFFVTSIFSFAKAQTFTDVASQYGINVQYQNVDQWGGGVSFFDFTNNGWDDLTFVMEDDSILFYANNGGTFTRLPSFLYGSGNVKQVIWVDIDNNGHMDLFVITRGAPYRLYKNDGNFNFTDISQQAGLGYSMSDSYGVSFADYNKNGFLDIYIAKYEWAYPDHLLDKNNQLYRNNGDGTFTNVTFQAGVGDGVKPSFQGVWLDYNNNGWPDLYVINDRAVSGNSLYKNNGDGTFTDVTLSSGTLLMSQDPMTTTVGDFNNNGFLDIYMTNTGPNGKEGMLLVNNGDETFTESASQYGVNIDKWSWGAVWIDYNNNTFQDLFVCTSFINENKQPVTNYFYENIQADTFYLRTDSVFPGITPQRSYGVAKGDINNNGFYDLVVHNRAPYNANLWENSADSDNHYIKISLQGTVSNRMAIGSWIRIYVDGNMYSHYTLLGENYVSQSSQHHIFGMEQYNSVDSITVLYPSGHTDVYYNLSVDTHYFFIEGETEIISLSDEGFILLCPGDSIELDGGNFKNHEWNTGHQSRYKTITDEGIFWVDAYNEFDVLVRSDTVEVYLLEMPELDIIKTDVSCHGNSDGVVTINFNNTFSLDYNLLWQTGDTGLILDNLETGVYAFTFIGHESCEIVDSVYINSPQYIDIQMLTNHEYTNSKGGINVLVNGGVPPYTIYLDDLLVESFPIENLDNGQYLLTVFDANNCSDTVDIEILYLSQNDFQSNSDIVLYPNPIRRGLPFNIDFPQNDTKSRVIIYDIYGRKLFDNDIEYQSLIYTDTFTGGIYLVEFFIKGKKYTSKLVVYQSN
ncbi:MAG: T9SS C-terminal target domain-containing protein [Chitinophagaceae bacterium]|nr:MAG: T9SS C-terminal target domain-containing protein [Chitinophagaceae bacterium]